MKIVHYRPNGKRPVCIDARWDGSLTKEQWRELWHNTAAASTNIYKVTCPACLKQIAYDINRRLGN
jgi:ketopantoate reductase